MWIEIARDGGRRFMATWRKEDEYVSKHWQKGGAKDTWKDGIVHESVEPAERHQIGLVDERKEPCKGTRRTDTCVAPRNMGASCESLLALCYFYVADQLM